MFLLLPSLQPPLRMKTEAIEDTVNPPPPPSRRYPGVDIIRVGLTWCILLGHTVAAFSPGIPFYVKGYGWMPGFNNFAVSFLNFMNAWQMPMFFFLSGVSSYLALFKRTEQQFREERVHRLLVPFLVLCLFNGVYSITYFAPRTPYVIFQITENMTLSQVAELPFFGHSPHFRSISTNTTCRISG